MEVESVSWWIWLFVLGKVRKGYAWNEGLEWRLDERGDFELSGGEV